MFVCNGVRFRYGICSNQVQDCHSWVSADGKGFMNWDWTAKGSDGLVFGPLPLDVRLLKKKERKKAM